MTTLRFGSTGAAVTTWQALLEIAETGTFDEATEDATRAWQRQRGLEPDGEVGPLTWGASGLPEPAQRRLRGVDVSQYQGIITDGIAEALVAEGCAFAYCRGAIGNETGIDSRFLANVEVFRRNGIAAGAYLFPFPLPHLDPIAQAEQHVRLIEGLGSNVGDLAPMIDAEWPPRETRLANGTIEATWVKWKCTPAQIRGWLVRYGARLDELSGCDCPYYTYRYWDDCIEGWLSPEIRARRLVLADYTMQGRVPTDDELARVKVPRGWDRITILQHDGDGYLRMPADGADVDWNVMLDPQTWRGSRVSRASLWPCPTSSPTSRALLIIRPAGSSSTT